MKLNFLPRPADYAVYTLLFGIQLTALCAVAAHLFWH